MTEKEKADSISKLLAKAARGGKPRQPTKVVVAKGVNRGIKSRYVLSLLLPPAQALSVRVEANRDEQTQGRERTIQDGGREDEEGDEGAEEDSKQAQEAIAQTDELPKQSGTCFVVYFRASVRVYQNLPHCLLWPLI